MELAHWKSRDLPFVPKRTLIITEVVSNPASPICSSDSGLERTCSFGSPSAATNIVANSYDERRISLTPDPLADDILTPHPLQPFSSQYLLACSRHGFSLGVSNLCSEGDPVEMMSIPVLQELVDSTQSADSLPSEDDSMVQAVNLMSSLSDSTIMSMSLLGESQLLVGTNTGILHSFEISKSPKIRQHKLRQHFYVAINEPILCISYRPSKNTHSSIEILLGMPYGYIVTLKGETDQKGNCIVPLSKMSRQIRRLTNSPVDCAIHCIVHCTVIDQPDTFWCSCGGNIIVLRASDWQRLTLMDTRIGRSRCEDEIQEVIQLLDTEIGIWSALSYSSTVILWDKKTYKPLLQLTYSETHRSDLSVMHYHGGFLLIGTQRGDIIVFKITQKHLQTHTKYTYRFITNHHIGRAHPIIDIYTNLLDNQMDLSLNGTLDGTITPHDVQILVVEGGKDNVPGKLYLFDLSLACPASLCVSPASSITSDTTVGSLNLPCKTPPLSVISSKLEFTPLKT